MKSIFIAAGHSNTDPGAVNERLKLKESELNEELRNLIQQKLLNSGINVLVDSNRTVSNIGRDESIRMAQSANGHKIDIHFNAGPATAHGVEVFADEKDMHIAQEYAVAIANVLGTTLRGRKGFKKDTESQHKNGLAWIRRLENSFLLEICFISNEREMRTYLQKKDEVAQAIANVIIKHNK